VFKSLQMSKSVIVVVISARFSEPNRVLSVARYNQCMQINTTAALKRKRKTVKSRPCAVTQLAKFIETRALELRRASPGSRTPLKPES
jgi:hypothetical protein